MNRHIVLLTYGEPPMPGFMDQLRYSWRILLGLTRSVAPIPRVLLPMIALSRARTRVSLWREERYGSPLEAITEAQAAGLRDALAAAAPQAGWQVHVAYEFRDPLLTDMIERLPAGEPVDIVPMYVADSAFTHEISRDTLKRWRAAGGAGRGGEVRVLPPLDEDTWAEVSARYIESELESRAIGGQDWALMLAAHGTLLEPPRPMETGRLATERICEGIRARLSARFGSIRNGWLNHVYGGRWTEPPAEEALRQIAGDGFRRVVYYPYGFAADNAESELEGRIALRSQPALEAVHLPCLNADARFIEALAAHVISASGEEAEAEPDLKPAFA